VAGVGGRFAALTAATAVASLLACGSSEARTLNAHATALARCAPANARIIKTGSRAQVYSLNKLVYGCDRLTRRPTKLGNATVCLQAVRVDHVALAYNLVAYGAERCGIDTGFTVVVVRRLSDGKRLAGYDAVSGPGLVESYQSIGSIVVRRDGSVAWIGSEHSIGGQGSRIEVDAVQRGKRSSLDSGPGIVASSLRLSLSMLSWRHGTTTRTAPFS
jgi:hypothetical protein